jgi:beta-lactamase superfamily II metal-dependent hydrolase
MIKNKKIIVIIISILTIMLISFCGYEYIKYSNGIELTQLSPITSSQCMSYVIKTKNGKVIVIDGGTTKDSTNLEKYINKYGGKVDAWFFTHSHNDHTGAFDEIINTNQDIKIGKIYVTLNDLNWAKENDPTRYENYENFYSALDTKKEVVEEVSIDEEINIDNVKIDILGVKNPEITVNAGNNQSMVFKMKINDKNILFLGDTGVESGNKLISTKKDKLKSDIVQMAHHGQNGVTEEFYKIVNPEICLWPTPQWLWDNDSGSGEDSGNYKTKETRSWIEKLNVKKNYVAKDGDVTIKVW